jgi:hypothetical protein
VMQVLKSSGGFMRLRTGRLSLYRWFPPEKSNTRFEDSDLEIYDTHGGDSILAHPRVAGAAFTILIPMGLGN